ncbi:hypothetical protein I4U23_008835 [Adineta vaga]|nr:hypothetical protein I4U23_008835 [Adineta vaga]
MSNVVISTNSLSHEAWKPGSPKSRRRSIIREFALNTSTHGLPGIARSQSKHNRFFWTISFLIFLGIMVFFVTKSIQDYFTYPTQTTLSYVVEQSQPFPAVTFCNYAPARYDLVIRSFLAYTNSLNITNTNDTSTFTLAQAIAVLDSMLINCTYNGQQCTANDFISFLSSHYGSCYTFNAKMKDTSSNAVRYTSDSGGSGQLQLRLYTHSHLYIPYITEEVSSGVVAMIHDNTQLPQIDIAGINLAPGLKHKLGYRKKANYFLSAPYTDCTDKIPLAMKAMFDRYEGADYTYSQSVCITLCTQAYIYQKCGCVSPLEWSARSIVLPDTDTTMQASVCSYADPCYPQAAIEISNSTEIRNEYCSGCTQECTKIDFLVTPSSAKAPSTSYAYLSKAFAESNSAPLPSNWNTSWLTEVEQNFVAIDVVCESIQIENYTQEASISAIDVLSNVGGHSGLWIGISFLSIMELVEMLYRLLRRQYQIMRHGV